MTRSQDCGIHTAVRTARFGTVGVICVIHFVFLCRVCVWSLRPVYECLCVCYCARVAVLLLSVGAGLSLPLMTLCDCTIVRDASVDSSARAYSRTHDDACASANMGLHQFVPIYSRRSLAHSHAMPLSESFYRAWIFFFGSSLGYSSALMRGCSTVRRVLGRQANMHA